MCRLSSRTCSACLMPYQELFESNLIYKTFEVLKLLTFRILENWVKQATFMLASYVRVMLVTLKIGRQDIKLS